MKSNKIILLVLSFMFNSLSHTSGQHGFQDNLSKASQLFAELNMKEVYLRSFQSWLKQAKKEVGAVLKESEWQILESKIQGNIISLLNELEIIYAKSMTSNDLDSAIMVNRVAIFQEFSRFSIELLTTEYLINSEESTECNYLSEVFLKKFKSKYSQKEIAQFLSMLNSEIGKDICLVMKQTSKLSNIVIEKWLSVFIEEIENY